MDWLKWPFSLTGCVKWSPRLRVWYAIEDLSTVISMEGDGSEPQAWLLDSLRPGMALIDVGAHHGRYSVTAARLVGPAGIIAAIEPHPRSLEVLKRNLELNCVQNVRVFPVACWSERTRLRSVSSELLALHSVGAGDSGSGTLPAVPLDDLADEMNVNAVDWIKVDVEGAELSVLSGAQKTIRRFRPSLFLEYHRTLPQLLDWLNREAYHVERQTEDPSAAGYGWLIAAPDQTG